MPVNTEVRIINPVWSAQAQGDLLEALAENRHDVKAAVQISNEGAERQGRIALAGIEEVDATDMHRRVRRFKVQEGSVQFR